MKAIMKTLCVLGVGAFIVTAVQSQAAMNDAAAGQKMYMDSCASCHKDKPAKMIGQPVSGLTAKMQKYKIMPNATGKVAMMQKALAPMSDQQITDIAVYLNGLK